MELPKEIVQMVVRMGQQGLTRKQAALILGINYMTFSKWLAREDMTWIFKVAGIEARRKHAQLYARQRKQS